MFDLEMLILSFAGGMFGAAIGGLPSFVLCGVTAVVGLAVYQATGDGTEQELSRRVCRRDKHRRHAVLRRRVARASVAARSRVDGLLQARALKMDRRCQERQGIIHPGIGYDPRVQSNL